MEIWKDIKGYEGMYQVSNLGRIKSLKFESEKILKSRRGLNSYCYVNLCTNGKAKNFLVHQLVAIAFLNHIPCGHKLVVDHINNDKYDNRVDNLQVTTHRYNVYKKQELFSSKYKGVYYHKKNNKWISTIYYNNKSNHLGCFDSEHEAHLAYQNKLKEIIHKNNL